MHTLTLAEAADFLKLCSDEIRRCARLGLLPGAKVGRRWVFIEAGRRRPWCTATPTSPPLT